MGDDATTAASSAASEGTSAAATSQGTSAAAPSQGTSAAIPRLTTAAGGGAGGGGGGRTPPPLPIENIGKQDDSANTTESEAPETTTAFAPLAFDQSYAWMLQLIVLVAAMTMFFPFLRNLFGIKPKKRQVVNYSSYETDEDEDCDDSEENLKECCED